MPRASQAINRFLIFSPPSLECLPLMDDVTGEGGSINSEFGILNQRVAAECWVLVPPLLAVAVLWGLCDLALPLLRSSS